MGLAVGELAALRLVSSLTKSPVVVSQQQGGHLAAPKAYLDCSFLHYPPCSAEGGGRMMEETRRQCQQEFVRSRRAHEWAQVGGRRNALGEPCRRVEAQLETFQVPAGVWDT